MLIKQSLLAYSNNFQILANLFLWRSSLAQRETFGQEALSWFLSRVTGAGNRRALYIRIRRRGESLGGHVGLVGRGARCPGRARDSAGSEGIAQNHIPVFAKSPAHPTVGGPGFRRAGSGRCRARLRLGQALADRLSGPALRPAAR